MFCQSLSGLIGPSNLSTRNLERGAAFREPSRSHHPELLLAAQLGKELALCDLDYRLTTGLPCATVNPYAEHDPCFTVFAAGYGREWADLRRITSSRG